MQTLIAFGAKISRLVQSSIATNTIIYEGLSKNNGHNINYIYFEMKIEIFAKVSKDGSITDGRKTLVKALKNFADMPVLITIEKRKKKRSNSQNAYFHSILPIIQESLLDKGFSEANSLEWVKDFVKYNCLIVEYVSEHGEVVKSLGKTSGLSTVEFMEMMERIKQWSAEVLDVYIPDPNQQIEIFKK